MKLKVRPITKDDVMVIFNKPWYATAVDIIVNGLDELSEEDLKQKIAVEYAEYYGYAVIDENNPNKVLTIMGAQKQEGMENCWWTWFFAPYDFGDFWREVTEFAKEVLEKEAVEKGAKEVRAYSPAGDRPEGIRWFKKLGFQKAQDFVIPMGNGHNIYMFQRFFD